jgi:DNA-directed RNA polymerase specialized sigma24 family protein
VSHLTLLVTRSGCNGYLVTTPYRAPLLLYCHYGWSVGEVAAALGINEGAARTRVYRAREMFRQAYERGNA